MIIEQKFTGDREDHYLCFHPQISNTKGNVLQETELFESKFTEINTTLGYSASSLWKSFSVSTNSKGSTGKTWACWRGSRGGLPK